MRPARIALAVLLLSGVAAAQTIDPAEHMPVGAFNRWQFVEAGDDTDIIAVVVKNVTVVRGVPRYNLRFPKIGELQDARLLLGFEDGKLLLHAANVAADLFDDKVSLERIEFEDPVLIAAASTGLDDPAVVTNVGSRIAFSVKIGPKKFRGHIDVNGTIGARWESIGGDVVTPLQTFPSADLARLAIDFNLDLVSDDVPKFDVDEKLEKTVQIVLAKGVGVVKFQVGSREYLLNKAILPGRTLGAFPPISDIGQFTFPTSNLLILHEAAGTDATDGTIALSGLRLEQRLSGRLVLNGVLDVPAAPAAQEVPLTLKGKARAISGGGVKMVLRGKAKHPGLPKRISLKARAIVTEASTGITFIYTAGKDGAGNLVAGEITVPLTPRTAGSATVTLNGMVDAHLEPSEKKRKLGSEGILAVGGLSFPVTLTEILKSKEGQPDKRTYKMVETGTEKPTVVRMGAVSTTDDYDLTKFKAKVLGLRVKPESLAGIVD